MPASNARGILAAIFKQHIQPRRHAYGCTARNRITNEIEQFVECSSA
jgi:hypothetical protein